MTTQTKPVPSGPLQNEPAVSIGASVSAVLVALFATLRAFDIGITEDMSSSLTALVLALCAIPAVSGILTRFFVYSPATTQEEVNKAAVSGVAADVAPPPPTDGAEDVPPEEWGIHKITRRDGSTVGTPRNGGT